MQDGQTSTFTIEYKGKTTTLEITASQSEDNYKASAQDLSYDDLARNPDTHKGKVVHFKGEVIQVIEDNTLTQYRISVTSTDYGGWDDPIFVTFETDSNNRFLEDDIVEFWAHPWEQLHTSRLWEETSPFLQFSRDICNCHNDVRQVLSSWFLNLHRMKTIHQ